MSSDKDLEKRFKEKRPGFFKRTFAEGQALLKKKREDEKQEREFHFDIARRKKALDTESSDSQRSRRRGLSGSRRSLLTGSERGVDPQGQRFE